MHRKLHEMPNVILACLLLLLTRRRKKKVVIKKQSIVISTRERSCTKNFIQFTSLSLPYFYLISFTSRSTYFSVPTHLINKKKFIGRNLAKSIKKMRIWFYMFFVDVEKCNFGSFGVFLAGKFFIIGFWTWFYGLNFQQKK